MSGKKDVVLVAWLVVTIFLLLVGSFIIPLDADVETIISFYFFGMVSMAMGFPIYAWYSSTFSNEKRKVENDEID